MEDKEEKPLAMARMSDKLNGGEVATSYTPRAIPMQLTGNILRKGAGDGTQGQEGGHHEGEQKEVPHTDDTRRTVDASEQGRVGVQAELRPPAGWQPDVEDRTCSMRAEAGPPRDGGACANIGGIPTHTAALAVRREGRGAPPQ